MIEVTSRRMECTLLTPDFSQMPAVALQTGYECITPRICHWLKFSTNTTDESRGVRRNFLRKGLENAFLQISRDGGGEDFFIFFIFLEINILSAKIMERACYRYKQNGWISRLTLPEGGASIGTPLRTTTDNSIPLEKCQ